MTLIRIAAFALLLGVAVSGVVWFGWGIVAQLIGGKPVGATPEAAEESKPAKAKAS
jgi:hypothetical protein